MNVFESFKLGKFTLKNRIVMAPMTRSRAINNIPNSLMKEYYTQRADAGLILSEATATSKNGAGYARIPGAYSDLQAEEWGKIAKSVQEEGGLFFVQLFHTGRVSNALNLPEGGETIGPSALPLTEAEMFTDQKGMQPHDTPRAMNLEDIKQAQDEFVAAAKRLISAGVNGIEIHSANGYLLEQFLNPKTNTRTDAYGADFKNRAKFVLEIVKGVTEAVGAGKVGVRFSPYSVFNEMSGTYPDLEELYIYLAQELSKLNIAYIHIVDQRDAMAAPEFGTQIWKTMGEHFKGIMLGGGGVSTAERAEELLNDGYDLVYIGRPFIANPDLISKLKNKEELTILDPDKLYSPGAEGYTDWAS